MKLVQDALTPTGIPVYALRWYVTDEHPTPPDAYLVYTTRIFESEHWDDTPISYTVSVYLNLWTDLDPAEAVLTVRAAMREAGFSLSTESETWHEETGQTLVTWTWQRTLPTELAPDWGDGNGT